MQQLGRSLRLISQASALARAASTHLADSTQSYSLLQSQQQQFVRSQEPASCSTSASFSTALRKQAASSSSRPGVPTSTNGSPLTVVYPFPIAYLKDREIVVHDLSRRPLGVDKLEGSTFNVPVRIDILHRVVRYLRAKWQQGTHKAKTRAEVSGGSRKPRPQKKTGRSRQGSIRSPLWKGGGANFGPRPRSHAHKLPKNVQLLGMKCALSAKCNEGRMVVVDSLAALRGGPIRTRPMVPMLTSLMEATGGKTALIVDSGGRGEDGGQLLRTAAGMMSGVHVMPYFELTVYHVLKYNALIISKPALWKLAKQLSDPPHRSRLPLRKAWWKREVQEFDKAAMELEAAGQQQQPTGLKLPSNQTAEVRGVKATSGGV